ncbi:hypothetical protein FDZ73_23060, partial [bacterium]
MINVAVYHLAGQTDLNEVRSLLDKMQQSYPHQVVEIDVTGSTELQARVGERLPVLECGPYHLRWPFTEQDLTVMLSAASQRREYLEQAGDKNFQGRVERGTRISGLDRVVLWLSRHYMLLFNLALFLFVGFAFLAPVLEKAGHTGPANVIY